MELWDLYTKDRVKTGQTMIRGDKLPENLYHMVVHACVFNKKGEMLVQQRQPFKSGWSNMWDITMGGSATAGDTSQTAVERELREELGLEISFEGIRPALTIHQEDGFDDIYVVEKEVDLSTLKLQYEEVQAAKWASREEIMKMIGEGVFIPYHKSVIELLFFLRNHRGLHTRKDDTRKC